MNPAQNRLQVYTKTRNAISSLLVNQLKQVLREEGLTISGTKSVLIDRVEKQLAHYFNSNDLRRFDHLTFLIFKPQGNPPSQASPNFIPNHQNHSPVPGPPIAGQSSSYGTPPSWHKFPNGQANVQINFKESPFYKVLTHLTSAQTLKVAENGRTSHEFGVKIPPEWAAKFDRDDPGRDLYRILLLGACDPASAFMRVDIAFPGFFDVKINGTDFRTNWKGLKGKEGSTRPADVTDCIRKTNSYNNTIVLTWANTEKKFYVRLDLVKQRTLESMIEKLKEGKTISKEQVIRDMQNKAKDSDIVATSTVMSLKCPLSYMRLQNPCRGNLCNHNQCFDALSYLQLQQQAPTWLCPICNRLATYENLQVDQYVTDILASVSEDVEQVSISPEGRWSQINQNESNRDSSVMSKQESVEDLEESPNPQSTTERRSEKQRIWFTSPLGTSSGPKPDSNSAEGKSEDPRSWFGSKLNTSPRPKPESNSANNTIRSSSNKRSHDVVDLTLESSEDEVPVPKRNRFRFTSSLDLESPSPPVRSLSTSHRQQLPSARSFGSMQG